MIRRSVASRTFSAAGRQQDDQVVTNQHKSVVGARKEPKCIAT